MTDIDPRTDLEAYLTERIAFYLELPADSISPDVPVSQYGLDSVLAVAVCGDIEDDFDIVVQPTLLWDVPTVAALAKHLRGLITNGPDD